MPSAVCFRPAFWLALVGLRAPTGVGWELKLEDFEDDDCIESPESDLLLHLMHELGGVFEKVLLKSSGGIAKDSQDAWADFDRWAQDGRIEAMQQLAPAVLGRPYCEPGKLAWLATTCVLLLRGGAHDEALECAGSLDEDLLGKMTVLSLKHETRLHLVLRSPWPAFRLLDILARLIPENSSTRLGACKKNTMWNSDPDVFDWPLFKSMLADAATQLVSDESVFKLRSEDGPLSRQHTARWQRIHALHEMKELVYVSHDVFDAYRKHHYKAGCHLGVISSYILQIFVVHLRDIEGRLQKLVSIVANLVNVYGPVQQAARTDWAVWRLMHWASLLQRAHPDEIWQSTQENELTAAKDAALTLVTDVKQAVETVQAAKGAAEVIFVTSAWGWMSEQLHGVLRRWRVVSKTAPLLVLCRDRLASDTCVGLSDLSSAGASAARASSPRRVKIRCIEAPQRLGVEAMVAKYLALASVAHLGVTTVWLDLDVFVLTDPSSFVFEELGNTSELVFARHQLSASISPAVLLARGSHKAASLLMGYAGWLRENPYLLDHQGWDQYLTNNDGDFAGLFDYKGRNTTTQDPYAPGHTFLASSGLAPLGTPWSFLTRFGSGDGWQGDIRHLLFFHFWGAQETQKEMFEMFYPKRAAFSSLSEKALKTILRYQKQPVSTPKVSTLLKGQKKLYIVAISYAHGCCAKSLKRNRDQALRVGVDEARSYGKQDLGPDWVAKNSQVLSQKRGAGWWLWKPYVVLRTLQDPAVPWDTGVVLWVDAGNYLHADPRPVLHEALEESDILALRLKQCLESDWTSQLTLLRMNVSSRYSLLDRPQLGAYFLAFRKTKAVMAFVENWLRLCEDEETLLGLQARQTPGGPEVEEDLPTFMTHQADQSIFSILFKSHGFRATPLEVGHRAVTLDRWRE
ncbi:Leucine-rich repeat protein SHOC-2 [Durusdinium trenchii]|uniref:Leucine-rich repeat protein SHOC-2 n=1 Tax=Durusdinium trenchii TaxID=1381693 RepID=A0ABP0MN40_9DINO